jgi:hypothetical protein
MIQRSSRWKIVFWVGLAMFGMGALAGFLAERSPLDALSLLFLGGIATGAITTLLACVALAVPAKASSVIAGGATSMFLAFFVPMCFEQLGGSVNVHGAGVAFMLFGTVAGVGGILLLAIGVVRLTSSAE